MGKVNIGSALQVSAFHQLIDSVCMSLHNYRNTRAVMMVGGVCFYTKSCVVV